jgi:peptidyl-prolyl cis-trans isomerase D
MLTSMRKNASSWIIKLLLGAIVVVFVLWGVGTNQQSRNPEVASVEGEPINYAEFAQVYKQLVDNMRRQFGDNLDEEMLQALGLKEQALNQLIDRAVMVREAQAMGFHVSDEELTAHIRSLPVFRVNGQFNRSQYEQMLAQFRMTPEGFEAAQRNDLLIQKIGDALSRTAKVTPGELADWYRWQNAAVNLQYVRFVPDQIAARDPRDDEIQAHFDGNQERYQTPAKRSARYLVFRTADRRPQVQLSDADVQAYYDEHLDEFKTEESVEARHILFKLASDARPADVETVRQKAEAVYAQIMAGEDFEAMARTHSDEASTGAKGGYLGTFPRGQMVKPFEDAAFALEAGQVSQPVRTEYGYHIIKVDRKNPAKTHSLAEAENKIRGQLTDSRARALALEAAESAYDLTYENEDLAAVAQQLAHDLQTTGMLARNDPLPGVSDATAFGRVLFGLEAGGISEVQEIDGDFYIVQADKIEDPQVPSLDSVRARVVDDWQYEHRWNQAEDQAKAFLLALEEGGTIEALSASQGLELKTTGFFKRNEAIADIGRLPQMTAAAFKLTKKNPLPDTPVRGEGGFYVFRFIERQQPEEKIGETQLEPIKAQLLQRKQRQIVDDWLAEARTRTDIQIDRKLLE